MILKLKFINVLISLKILLNVSVLNLQINSKPIDFKNFGHSWIKPDAISRPPPIHIILKNLFCSDIF